MSTGKTFTLNNGVQVPAVGLGTYKSKPSEVKDAVACALEHGYRHIDSAYRYMNEKEAGEAIAESGVPRDEIFLTSKLWNTYHSRVEEALDKSLQNLGVDYLDLFLMHYPVPMQPGIDDDNYPKNEKGEIIFHDGWSINDTWAEMEKLLDTGKVRAIGVSNFDTNNLERLSKTWKVVPAVNQVELHPLLAQDRLKEYCDAKGIHLTAYSPLGSASSSLHTDATINAIAEKNNCSTAQVMIGWGVAKGWSVVPKSVTAARIRTNFQDIELSSEDVAAIDKINKAEIKRYMAPNWGVEMFGDDKHWKASKA